MLGLKRGKVKLSPHNPKWAKIFEKEKKMLQKSFGRMIVGIQHVGSTAIPGIPAKNYTQPAKINLFREYKKGQKIIKV